MSLVKLRNELRAQMPAAPISSERLRLAGRHVLLRFGSARLAELLSRSMRSLRQPFEGPPDLVVSCWTGEDLPAFKRPADWPDTGVVFMEEADVRLSWESPDGPLVVYDRAAGQSWMLFARHDSFCAWEVSTPFRKILHWWAADLGLQLVHAAAVGRTDGGLLLVGRGGSGKSTTALACLDGMLGYAGDDYCLVDPGERPWVHGLYLSAKGDSRTATLLPGLRDSLRHSPCSIHGQSIIFADEVRPEAVVAGFPLRAIVVPRIVGGSVSRLERLSATDTLRAFAPSTLLQLPGERASGLGRLSDLVRRVPAWMLCLGDDSATAVTVLAELLDRPIQRGQASLTES